MGSVVFLQLPFLLGLAAVALPPLIHLIHRQRRRKIPFSSLRFLLQTDRRSARRHRIVDFLVLALRMLLLGLLALGLAQPVLRPRGSAQVDFGKLSLAVVLDDSLSMQRSDGGGRLFDRALEDARAVLRGIPQDAEAFLLLTSGRTPAALSVPASPPSSLAESMTGLNPSSGGRPVAPALLEAVAALQAAKNPHRSILLVTDLQKRAFDTPIPLDPGEFSKQVQSLLVLDLKPDAPANLGVLEVAALPEVVFPGMPVRIRARVANAEPTVRTAPVSLWMDDRKVQGEPLAVPAGGVAETVFDQVLHEPGIHRIAVRLEPDDLGGDNARFLPVRVLPILKVWLVTPPRSPGTPDDGLYLATALEPLQSPNYSGAAPVRVVRADYAQADRGDPADYDFVCVVDSGALPPRLAAALKAYVEKGGHMLSFPALALLAPGAELRYAGLPIRELRQPRDGADPVPLGQYDRKHPVFSLLARTAPELFAAVSARAYLLVDESRLGAYDRVAARWSDGAPALVESGSGPGSALAWTAGARTEWSDLPLRPLFLPLVFESLKYAAGAAELQASGGEADAGIQIRMTAAQADRQIRVEGPTGSSLRLTLAAGRTELACPEASEPGFYAVRLEGPVPASGLAAVNAAAGESDFGRAAPEAVTAFFPPSPALRIEEDPALVVRHLSHAATGVPLAGWLMALALAALLGEMYLSNALLRGGEGRPSRLLRLWKRGEGR